MDKDHNPEWQAIWANAQKKYLEGVNRFYSQLQQTSSAGSAFAPERFLNAWSEVASSTLPKELFPVFNNLLNETASINSLSQAFHHMLASLSEMQEDNDDWMEVLHHHMDSLKEKLTGLNHDSACATVHKGLVESMQYWQDYIAAIDDHLLPVSAPRDPSKLLAKTSGIPSKGGNRPYAEDVKLAVGLWNEYQQACMDYQAMLCDIALLAIDKLRDQLIHSGLAGKKINTLKQFYDLWIEAQEEAYAEIVFTEEYARKFAQLINLSMLFKKHGAKVSAMVLENANGEEGFKGWLNEKKQTSKESQPSRQGPSAGDIRIDALERELIELRNMIAAGKKERE